TTFTSDPYSDPNVPYANFPVNPLYKGDVQKLKQANIIRNLNITLSIASIIGGFIVLNILSGAAVIAYTLYTTGDTNVCTFIGWAMSFLPTLYLFLTVMIAFNLQ
ncbi:1098_t:CDS:2, partial [Dentiscutata heterogama]